MVEKNLPYWELGWFIWKYFRGYFRSVLFRKDLFLEYTFPSIGLFERFVLLYYEFISNNVMFDS